MSTPSPAETVQAIASLWEPHRGGHTCTDGRWYNRNTGARRECPAGQDLDLIAARIAHLTDRVHEAAHDDEAALFVAMGATGYSPEWVEDLDDDDRAGMLTMGRMAAEALSEWLERDPDTEPTAAALFTRLRAERDAPPGP